MIYTFTDKHIKKLLPMSLIIYTIIKTNFYKYNQLLLIN